MTFRISEFDTGWFPEPAFSYDAKSPNRYGAAAPKAQQIPKPTTQHQQTREACWHCSRSLQYVRGKGYSYVVASIDGYDRKLHVSCLGEPAWAIGDEAEGAHETR